MPGFQTFFFFLPYFVLAKIAPSSIWVKQRNEWAVCQWSNPFEACNWWKASKWITHAQKIVKPDVLFFLLLWIFTASYACENLCFLLTIAFDISTVLFEKTTLHYDYKKISHIWSAIGKSVVVKWTLRIDSYIFFNILLNNCISFQVNNNPLLYNFYVAIVVFIFRKADFRTYFIDFVFQINQEMVAPSWMRNMDISCDKNGV